MESTRYGGVDVAAKQEDRHPETIRRWIAAGKIDAFKPPGIREWVIDLATLPSQRREEEARRGS